MTEPRKATDIILELEQKVDALLNIVRTQDLNLKIISNKLNTVTEALEKKEPAAGPRITAESVRPTNHTQQPTIPVTSEASLPLESEPKGFRRTSRPETFAGDDAYLKPQASTVNLKYPVQLPEGAQQGQVAPGMRPPPGRGPEAGPAKPAEVVVPKAQTPSKQEPVPQERPKAATQIIQNAIPIQQRVVNAHGKSLFLADVEIINLSTMTSVTKTRTNGTGKWMTSLGVGQYRVIIKKMDSATKEVMEVTQDVDIDGSQSPLELQTIIIKGISK